MDTISQLIKEIALKKLLDLALREFGSKGKATIFHCKPDLHFCKWNNCNTEGEEEHCTFQYPSGHTFLGIDDLIVITGTVFGIPTDQVENGARIHLLVCLGSRVGMR